MTAIQVKKAFLKAVGFAGYLLLSTFAVMFAFLALVAFVSVFTDNVIIGLFGTAAAGSVAWITWSIRKDTL